MTKLTSMKQSDDKDFDTCSPCCGPDMAFPYGLQLYLNDATCEKLGISKALPPGTKVTIQATGIVTRASESVDREGKDVCLDVQITDMAMSKSGMVNDAAKVLYPNAS